MHMLLINKNFVDLYLLTTRLLFLYLYEVLLIQTLTEHRQTLDGLAMKIRRVKQKIVHKTCKK